MASIAFNKAADTLGGFQRYLARTPCPANLPAPEPSINCWWLPNVAGAAKKFGVAQELAETLAREAMTRPEKGSEIRHCFNRFYGNQLRENASVSTPYITATCQRIASGELGEPDFG